MERIIDIIVFTIFVETLILLPNLAVIFGSVLVYNFIRDAINDTEYGNKI